ncbi:hypothetical protein [Nonomuraea typhae]|uniref:Uncharacterized protein n=1 Tax=Nonomuraea typhae TaxID=2603600 RepID=A0ABW7YMH2_9ACTN
MSTPEERSTQASVAAHTRWAGVEDRTAETADARRNSPASFEYWMGEVDPQGRMPHVERVKRAENAKAAYYKKLMAKARAAKAAKAAREAA